MAQNLQFDPIKRDYIVQNGSPLDGGILEACYYALAIPQNNWLYVGTNQGSLLYTLIGIKRTSDIEQNFFSYATNALNAQVVASEQAQAVGLKNLQSTRTGTSNEIEVIPSTMPVSSQFNFIPV